MKRILITGAAGFIGFHVCLQLAKKDDVELILIDSLMPTYSETFTNSRKVILEQMGLDIIVEDLASMSSRDLRELVGNVDIVIHLAASPGVRVPKGQEDKYFENNVIAFSNVLNYAAMADIPMIFASSSSVYGDSGTREPVKENSTSNFIGKGIYALAKWSNEELSRIYYKSGYTKSIGLRFFSVYGKFGRPDMAYFSFTRKVLEGETIELYGDHNPKRDFTPIEFVVADLLYIVNEILLRGTTIFDQIYKYDDSNTLNIGTGNPVEIRFLLRKIEEALNKHAQISYTLSLIHI